MTHLEQTASPGTERGRMVVKPLEWKSLPDYGPDAEQGTGILSGLYGIFVDEDSAAGAVFAEWVMDPDHFCTTYAKPLGRFHNWDAAKDAAQADYERRILSAIESPDLIAAAPTMLEALKDALCGWRYIRDHHGDLYGVGWDRVEHGLNAAIALAEGRTPGETT